MEPAPLAPLDSLQRPLRDLRISVTDRCNLRCAYCMPREVFGPDYAFLPRAEILSFEEIARVARVFATLGVEKLRLTGGEPLLRRDLERLVGMLREIPGIREIALTTNGILLADKAAALRAAGLSRVTVSVDSLRPETFARLADSTIPLARVLGGIDAALAAGFAPIKINMVVKRGVNDDEIVAMARRFGGPHFILRFIEYMDVGTTNGWRLDEVVPAAEIVARLRAEMPLQPLAANYRGEVARRYALPGGGEMGIISSVTHPFCQDCARARLSADGRLFTCLFAERGTSLREALRSGAPDADLAATVTRLWRVRDDRYSELRAQSAAPRPKAEMSLLGG